MMWMSRALLLGGESSRGHALKAYRQILQSANASTRAGARRVRMAETTKKTLKERLLSPTTGRPFAIGQAAVGAGAVLGMGALGVYGLGLGSRAGAIDRYGIWPDYVRERLHSTYAYLGASLGVTAGAAVAASRSPAVLRLASANSMLAIFGTFAAVIGAGVLVRSVPYTNPGAKHMAWLVHAGLIGAVLSPMVMLGGPLLVRAAWYTAGMVGGLSAIAMTAPSEKFLSWAGPLSMGLGVVVVASLGSAFLPPTTAVGAGLASIAIYGGLLLFGAFLLYDTQAAVKTAESLPPHLAFDPINAQLRIYMDVINIFIRLVTILGGNRRK